MFTRLKEQYSVSKTLRFQLIPYNEKVVDNLHYYNIVKNDQALADNYDKAKKIIDHYYRDYIENRLQTYSLDDQLCRTIESFHGKSYLNDEDWEALQSARAQLREQIAQHLQRGDRYPDLFRQTLIRQIIPEWLSNKRAEYLAEKEEGNGSEKVKEIDHALEVMAKFYFYVTYFRGYFENRKSLFSSEEVSSGIAYRIVHDNLPRFLLNRGIIGKIERLSPSLYSQLDQASASYIEIEESDQLKDVNSLLQSLSFKTMPLSQKEIIHYNRLVRDQLNPLIESEQKKLGQSITLPLFNQLYQQILNEAEPIEFQQINDDASLLQALETMVQQFFPHTQAFNLSSASEKITDSLVNANLNKIWIQRNNLASLSSHIFNDPSMIDGAITFYEEMKKQTEPHSSNKNSSTRESSRISIAQLEEILEYYGEHQFINRSSRIVQDHFRHGVIWQNGKQIDLYHLLESEYPLFIDQLTEWGKQNRALTRESWRKNQLRQSQSTINAIKRFLDLMMALLRYFAPLSMAIGEKKSELQQYERDNFYTQFDPFYRELSTISHLYRQVRDYLSQKPYSLQKFRLNFNNTQLGDGWDRNKEKDYTTVLLRQLKSRQYSNEMVKGIEEKEEKEGERYYCYYLVIMNMASKDRRLFEQLPEWSADEIDHSPIFEKMNYKLMPSPHMQIPRVFFSKKGRIDFPRTEAIERIYKEKSFQLGKHFNRDDLHQLIDFYKTSIESHPDWSTFQFRWSPTEEYENIAQFYQEIREQGYQLSFESIPQSYIESLIESRQIFLFQIYNRDFSPHATGMPNLHTLYWHGLFSEANLNNPIHKLDGGAEIFYRPASLPHKITHPQGEAIEPKSQNAHHTQRQFSYDLIKDRRFTQDSFHLHLPITLNHRAPDRQHLNDQVNAIIRKWINPSDSTLKKDSLTIMGIDRGRENLVVISIINGEGKLIKQQSFNRVGGVDYRARLKEAERLRNQPDRRWEANAKIRQLERGYLSALLHEIVTLIERYQSIVILEDLSSGYKRRHMGLKHQTYRDFERALIEKLNFLLFKNRAEDQPDLRSALQLSNKFESFRKIGRQSGILFFVAPSYTRRVDPTTGFINLIRDRLHYRSIDATHRLLSQCHSFIYQPESDSFILTINYKTMGGMGSAIDYEWSIVADNQERFIPMRGRDNTQSPSQYIANNLKYLFEEVSINYQSGEDIIPQLLAYDGDGKVALYRAFLFNLRVLLAIQYYDEKGNDFLLSPIKNSDGIHYDSRACDKQKAPIDSDHNSAYHMALKGAYLAEQIVAHNPQADRRLPLSSSNEEWLFYLMNRHHLD